MTSEMDKTVKLGQQEQGSDGVEGLYDDDSQGMICWHGFDQISDMTLDASSHSFGIATRPQIIDGVRIGGRRGDGAGTTRRREPFLPILPSSYEASRPVLLEADYDNHSISLSDHMIWPSPSRPIPNTSTTTTNANRIGGMSSSSGIGLWNIAKFMWQHSNRNIRGFREGGGGNHQRNRSSKNKHDICSPPRTTNNEVGGCAPERTAVPRTTTTPERDDDEERCNVGGVGGIGTPPQPNSDSAATPTNIKLSYPEGLQQEQQQQPGAVAVYPAASFVASATMLSSNAQDYSINDDNDNNTTSMYSRKNVCVKRPFRAILFFLVFAVIVFGAMSVGIVLGTTISKRRNSSTNNNDSNGDGEDSSSSQSSRMMKLIRYQLDEYVYPRSTVIPPFDDPTTSQYKALKWLIHNDTLTIQHYYDRVAEYNNLRESKDDDPYIERLAARFALAVLYYSTNMDEDNNGFLSPSEHECDWKLANDPGLDEHYGIGCDSSMSITRLNLADCNLSGTIPEELFLALTDITSLDLSRNDLHGPIPSNVFKLSRLDLLNLSNNNLSSSLPHELSRLTNLQLLNVAGNQLTGKPPTTLHFMRNMKVFNVSHNLLSGMIMANDFVVSSYNDNVGNVVNSNIFGGMDYLEVLDLSHCNFNGRIHRDSIVNLVDLISLHLDYNEFSAVYLPTTLDRFTSLENLSASHNRLTNVIPTELGLLTSLQMLDLSYNSMKGSLPEEIGRINSLKELYLNNNMFGGTIPQEFSDLSSLRSFTIHSTSLSGDVDFLCSSIPAWLDQQSLASSSHIIGISVDCQNGDIIDVECTSCCNCHET